MNVSTLLRDPSAPGLAEPGNGSPAIPSASPMTTQTLVDSLKVELSAPPAAAPSAVAPATSVSPVPAGSEPSPAAAVAGAASPEVTDLEELPVNGQWPAGAIDTVTKLRHQKRDQKKVLEAERDAEKQRADALAAELAKVAQAPANGESKRVEQPAAPAAPSSDPLSAVPEVQAARQAERQHAANYRITSGLLAKVESNLPEVVSELKSAGVNLADDAPASEVRLWLEQVRDDALLKHNGAAAHKAAIEREAQAMLAHTADRWTQEAHSLLPALKDPKSAEFAESQRAYQAFPWLQSDPRGPRIVAALIEGNKVLEARARKGAPAAPAVLPPAPLPTTSASLPAATVSGTDVQAARDKFFKSGKPEDRQAWVKATLATA